MPGGDGTGPDGRGGWCTPLWMSGQIPKSLGLGLRGFFGGGFWGRRVPGRVGRGRGRMNMFYATGLPGWMRFGTPQPQTPLGVTQNLQQPTMEQELQWLEQEGQLLTQQLEQIKKRIEELRK
jgi:hypothetical protein